MRANPIKIAVSLVVIIAALAVLLFQTVQLPPKIEPRPHEALGEALAERAVKLLGSGGHISFIAPDIAAFQYPGAEVQWKAFHKALRRSGQSVAVTNWLKLDPLRPQRMPPGEEFFRKLSEADVVVSLMGPPILAGEQKTRFLDKKIKVIAVCSGDMPRQINLKALLTDNVLQAAVISRPKAGSPPASDNLSAWFDSCFQWVTSQNASDLEGTER